MARAPPPANRRKHRNCWAGWLPTLFVDIIQLRPPRSSRFSKAGDSGCGYLGVLISYAAERIIPSHIPNLHLRRQKLIHQDRPTFLQPIIPKAAPPKSTSPHRIIYAQIPHSQRIMTKSTSQARRFIHNISTCCHLINRDVSFHLLYLLSRQRRWGIGTLERHTLALNW